MEMKYRFLTFLFALIPGAGQMYQWRLKRGVSIMACFCGLIALFSWLHVPQIGLVFPVVWFYSFFDCINHIHQTRDELAALPDTPVFGIAAPALFERKNVFTGLLITLLGVFLLYSSAIRPLLMTYNMYVLVSTLDKLPGLLIAAAVIAIGVKLVMGPAKEEKKEIAEQEENGDA